MLSYEIAPPPNGKVSRHDGVVSRSKPKQSKQSMQANTESKHTKQAYVNTLGDVNMVLKTTMELVSSSKKLAHQASKHSKQASNTCKRTLKASTRS